MTENDPRHVAAAVAEASRDANAALGLLGLVGPGLNHLVAEVVEVVGGSTQRVDQVMVSTIRAAALEVRRAEEALRGCLSVVGSW